MAKTSLKVSVPTFHEIAQKMEETGNKIGESDTITLTKDTALERPIDWRMVTVRKDVVTEAAKVYHAPMDNDGFEITNSVHFVNFVDDVLNYVINGTKPENQVKTTAAAIQPKKAWGK